MGLLSGEERHSPMRDPTRDRTILLNHILLAGVSLVATVLALALGQIADGVTYALGMTMIYLAVAAAILLPWRRLPLWAAGVLPVVDIVAVAVLRAGAPEAGLGLLWAFPAMWLASAYGVLGILGGTVGISGVVAFVVASGGGALTTSSLLLPLTICALATTSYLATRRATAQRWMLSKQSEDLQRAAVRARRQEDLVTEVLDAVDFGVIRITPDGALVVTNEAHARLQGSGGSADPSVRAFSVDGVTRLDPDLVPLERARRGEHFENELVWYGAPGERRRALSVTARGLVDVDGAGVGTIVVSRDVTSEEQALRARDDLIASVSHELRTPLTSIMGYLELALDDDRLPESTRRDLQVAERNASRLLELVSDILAMSTISRRGADLCLEVAPTEVREIVLGAVEAEAPRAAQRRMTIELGTMPPAVAAVDAHRMRQVVDNLLTNAVKYNRDGGWVRVEVSEDDTNTWIAVHDDGPGISPDELPQLFERFFRSDAVRNSSVHGSGLGLSISRDIVVAHGGDILVESQVGMGSTFRVRLPKDAE